MNGHNAIAHVAKDGRCHDLYDHLTGTAKRAGDAAQDFDPASWAELAGLWHDLGKYSKFFQDMIRSASGIEAHIETRTGRVDHSTAGALLAVREFGNVGLPLAFVVAGHHAGLADKTDLDNRCAEKHGLLDKVLAVNVPREVFLHSDLRPPSFLKAHTGRTLTKGLGARSFGSGCCTPLLWMLIFSIPNRSTTIATATSVSRAGQRGSHALSFEECSTHIWPGNRRHLRKPLLTVLELRF